MAPVKGLLKKSGRKSHLHTIGDREIETHGLDTGFWRCSGLKVAVVMTFSHVLSQRASDRKNQ
jgi:hypothetical protein